MDMKHIKQDFDLKTWFQAPGGLKGWGSGQNESFSKYGHVAYQVIGHYTCSIMIANSMTADTFSTQGVGSKGQNIFFSESGHAAYQMKGKEV